MATASALLTTIMLSWGLSSQGQSPTNFQQGIKRNCNAAREDVSIDSALFPQAGSPPNTCTTIDHSTYAQSARLFTVVD